MAIRALLGHELGRTDPCAHLDAELLGPTARQGDRYPRWLEKYQRELNWSREDFVKHHDMKYGGRLPVWAAVEIIDWGSLMHLYNFAPAGVREDVADSCGFSPSQLASWLNVVGHEVLGTGAGVAMRDGNVPASSERAFLQPGPRLFVARNPSGLNLHATLAWFAAAHRAAGVVVVAAPTDHEGKEFCIRQGVS